MKKIPSFSITLLKQWRKESVSLAQQGQVFTQLPRFARVDPSLFVAAISTVNQPMQGVGDTDHYCNFTSVIKPFMLLYCLAKFGEKEVFSRVGQTPSSLPYNSISQLEQDKGFPCNPLINSGAIALADLFFDHSVEQSYADFIGWFNRLPLDSSNKSLSKSGLVLDEELMASSEGMKPSLNKKTNEQISLMVCDNDANRAKRARKLYTMCCCSMARMEDVMNLGTLLLNPPKELQSYCQSVIKLMATCGLYQNSQSFFNATGLASKSGISGLILSVIPQKGCVVCISPPLDRQGNSIGAQHFMTQCAAYLAQTHT